MTHLQHRSPIRSRISTLRDLTYYYWCYCYGADLEFCLLGGGECYPAATGGVQKGV